MSIPHITDAEVEFKAVNTTPDFCLVDGQVVPCDIFQTLDRAKAAYAAAVQARGAKVLRVGSVVEGVIGDAGTGVISATAQTSGHVVLLQGHSTVLVEGAPVCRDGDPCLMNAKV